jgi:glycerophosphoryl diester phosphodiesterase
LNPALRADGRVQVIAHRGASALRPEHTLAAYLRAIEDGADFIEPDLVMTRDGILVARHGNELGGSTDVATHVGFRDRRCNKRIDGEAIEGWFCEDFTLDELRRLRAREPLPELRGRAHDGLHPIPSFDEIVDLLDAESRRRDRRIGIIPELKHSSYHRSIGLNLEQALLAASHRHPILQAAPFGIQSFEISNLEELRLSIADAFDNVFLVQLLGDAQQVPFDRQLAGDTDCSYARMSTPQGLDRIARYADAIAVHRRQLLPLDPDGGGLGAPTALIRDAHAAGLAVQAWSLRPENHFLPPAFRCGDDPAMRCEEGTIREMRALVDAGVDALFTDDPALARRAVGGRANGKAAS